MVLAALMAMMAAAQGDDADALLAAYREKTRAEIRCTETAELDEILVCGARTADRFRLPLVEYQAGDPRHEGVYEQAERLQAKTTRCQDHSVFLVGCGMVGVSSGISFGAGGFERGYVFRPLAK